MPRPRTCDLFHKSASLRLSIGPSCDGLTSLEPLLWAAALFNINLKQQTCQIHLSGVSCSNTHCSPNSKRMWSMTLRLQNDFLSASLCNIFWDYEAWILTFIRQLCWTHEPLTVVKAGPATHPSVMCCSLVHCHVNLWVPPVPTTIWARGYSDSEKCAWTPPAEKWQSSKLMNFSPLDL